MDRVSVSEAGGHEFESHRDHTDNAKVAKLVDAQASGVCSVRRKGSSPFFRTILPKNTSKNNPKYTNKTAYNCLYLKNYFSDFGFFNDLLKFGIY